MEPAPLEARAGSQAVCEKEPLEMRERMIRDENFLCHSLKSRGLPSSKRTRKRDKPMVWLVLRSVARQT